MFGITPVSRLVEIDELQRRHALKVTVQRPDERASLAGHCANQQVADAERLAAFGALDGPFVHLLPCLFGRICNWQRRKKSPERTAVSGPNARKKFSPHRCG